MIMENSVNSVQPFEAHNIFSAWMLVFTTSYNTQGLSWNINNILCYQNLIILYYSLYSDDSDQSYKIKDECQNITALYCDLTAETPFVYDVSYHAKVLVNGRTHGSTETRFKPSEHSKNTHTQSYISLHLIVRTIISQYSSIHLFFPPSSSFLHSYFGSTHLVYIHNRVISVC